MTTITGTVTLPNGDLLHAETDVPVVVPPVTLFGMDTPPTEHVAHLGLFPGCKIVSAFGKPGAGIPSWGTDLRNVPRSVIAHPRFKDTPTPALVNPWLDAIPADVTEAWITHDHEPDIGQDPVQYRANQVALRQIVNAHPNGHKVKVVTIYMLYQLRSAGMNWRDYYGTMPDGTPAAHILGFDCYVNRSTANYEDPSTLFEVPLAIGAATGLPVAITELGALVVTGKPGKTPTRHAAWLASCVAFLQANLVKAACYWCNIGSQPDWNFHLEPLPASLSVWQGACRG